MDVTRMASIDRRERLYVPATRMASIDRRERPTLSRPRDHQSRPRDQGPSYGSQSGQETLGFVAWADRRRDGKENEGKQGDGDDDLKGPAAFVPLRRRYDSDGPLPARWAERRLDITCDGCEKQIFFGFHLCDPVDDADPNAQSYDLCLDCHLLFTRFGAQAFVNKTRQRPPPRHRDGPLSWTEFLPA